MPISTQKSLIRNRLWLAIPSLLLIAALWFDWLPFLRGNAEWQWPLRPIEVTARSLIPIATLILYGLIGARWLRGFEREALPRHYTRWFLIFVTLAAPIIQLALAAAVSRHPLLEFFGPTVSVHNSGYFTTAVATPDLNQLLARYPALMPQLPIHAQSHPPGPVVAQWLSWQFFRAAGPLTDAIALPLRSLQCHNPGLMALANAQIASASLGMLLPLIGGLAVWPLFGLGRRVVDVRVAAWAAVLFPIMPLFAMWPAQWDQIYPLLLLTGLYFVHTGLAPRPSTTLRSAQDATRVTWWRIFLAGVPLSIASFFSVGNFVLMVIVGVYGAMWLWLQRTSRRLSVAQALRLLVIFAFGCGSVWLAYALVYSVNPLDVIATGSRLAFESTTGHRSYGAWLLGNPIDFAVFLGMPLVFSLLSSLVTLRRSNSATHQSFLALSLATLGTLIVLWLSGIVRGEVGRLWIYFGPLLSHIAARFFTQHFSLFTRHSSLVITLLALQLFVMNTRWLVNDSFLDEPPDRSVVLTSLAPPFTITAEFDQQIALRGYDAHTTTTQIDLTLYWQALSQPPHAYTVFVHVSDVTGRQVGQQDNMPVRDQLPTSCWVPGEYVTDPYTLRLADGARGPFTIQLGLYRADSGARVSRSDVQGDSVTLTVP